MFSKKSNFLSWFQRKVIFFLVFLTEWPAKFTTDPPNHIMFIWLAELHIKQFKNCQNVSAGYQKDFYTNTNIKIVL